MAFGATGAVPDLGSTRSLWSAELLLRSVGDGEGDKWKGKVFGVLIEQTCKWRPGQAPTVWVRARGSRGAWAEFHQAPGQ